MKQFLSQEKLEEIQEIIEMKIVHRYRTIVFNKEDSTQVELLHVGRSSIDGHIFSLAGRLFTSGKIGVGRSSTVWRSSIGGEIVYSLGEQNR
jgi:hypothetical protein